MVGLNLFFPVFYTLLSSTTLSHVSRQVCLGEEYKVFFLEKWTDGTFFETAWSGLFSVILGISLSNIPDLYFIYSCSKEVQKSDENVKNILSNQAYLQRKR